MLLGLRLIYSSVEDAFLMLNFTEFSKYKLK